jgi:hypothetical protein
VKGYARSSILCEGKFSIARLGAESRPRIVQPHNIHVGHFVIDGAIGRPGDPRGEARDPKRCSTPDAIADTYFHVFRQHRSAWAWEVELRPWVENF